jgi:glycine/D-amino acid oxidase-like deaminating enzyme
MNTITVRPPVAAAKADRSYWLRSIEADAVTRPLHGAADCDVAIVGGGYAGLWTASRIKEQAPETRVTVLEADFCGSGASGRNGGQVHSWFAEIDMLRALVGENDALMLCRATADAIRGAERLQASGAVDMGLGLDGWLWTASSTAQERRLGRGPRPLPRAWRRALPSAPARGHPAPHRLGYLLCRRHRRGEGGDHAALARRWPTPACH